ncbi:hypothetical protein QM012_005364 [Aureobasidium pullulans]|uniref:C2H2-type domain-containing protein n=1 Tax=Aureobasidium pullulans TaxID=5580 RepID=A0ABR0T6C5_AURPU
MRPLNITTLHLESPSPCNMARTKRKPVQLRTPPRARPLWSHGLSSRDMNHITMLVDMGMDEHRVKLEPGTATHPERSTTITQTASGRESVNTPDKQDEALEEGHMHDEDELLSFTSQTRSPVIEEQTSSTTTPAVEETQNAGPVRLSCRRCASTFERQHELVAHVWHEHMKQDNLEWVPGPVHEDQEAVMQELIGAFVEYENLAGVCLPVPTPRIQPSPSQGPAIATRVPLTRPAPILKRSQSSMMGVFAVNDRSTVNPSRTTNTPRAIAPTSIPIMPPNIPAPTGSSTAGAFPPGALESHQPFKLGQPVPLGVKLPTNAGMNAFKWEAYHRRTKTAFDWNDRKDVRLANHWRSSVTQAAFKRLGIRVDRRRRAGTAISTATNVGGYEGEEGENENGEEGQDGMDVDGDERQNDMDVDNEEVQGDMNGDMTLEVASQATEGAQRTEQDQIGLQKGLVQ